MDFEAADAIGFEAANAVVDAVCFAVVQYVGLVAVFEAVAKQFDFSVVSTETLTLDIFAAAVETVGVAVGLASVVLAVVNVGFEALAEAARMAVLVAVAADFEAADVVAGFEAADVVDVVGFASVDMDGGLDVLAAVVDVVDFETVEDTGLTVVNSGLAAVIVDYLAVVCFAVVCSVSVGIGFEAADEVPTVGIVALHIFAHVVQAVGFSDLDVVVVVGLEVVVAA